MVKLFDGFVTLRKTILTIKQSQQSKLSMKILSTHIVGTLNYPTRFSDYSIGVFAKFQTKQGTKKAIKKGEIILNKEKTETGRWLKEGDEIQWIEIEKKEIKSFDLDLEIVLEDEYLAIVNKPAGLITSGNQFKTLTNCLPQNLNFSNQPDALQRPQPAHRLDSQTSGLVLVGKTSKALIELGNIFKNRTLSKTYQAIVVGKTEKEGVISQSIDNQEAITHFKTIKTIPSLQNEFVSLLDLSPKTGRTHQLRIHLSQIGHPIIGDKLYGKEGSILKHKGLFLAAVRLQFSHPITFEKLDIKIEMPYKFQSLLEREKRRWEKFKL